MGQEDLQWVGGSQLLLILHNDCALDSSFLVFYFSVWVAASTAWDEELCLLVCSLMAKVLQGLSIQRSLKVTCQ